MRHPATRNFSFARPAAFTLVELLVVIAIIAVLAGLIFAVMGSVQNKGKATKCLHNLRQIGMAFGAFATDHEGAFPAHVEEKSAAELNETVWSAKLVLGHYLPEPTSRDTALFLCPFDPDAKDDYSEAYRSYAYNPGPDEMLPVRLPNIENPASTIMLAEWYGSDPFASTDYHPLWDGEGWGWRRSGGLYAHHADGTSCVLFYDLHVEAVKNHPAIPAPDVPYKWSFGPKDEVPP